MICDFKRWKYMSKIKWRQEQGGADYNDLLNESHCSFDSECLVRLIDEVRFKLC